MAETKITRELVEGCQLMDEANPGSGAKALGDALVGIFEERDRQAWLRQAEANTRSAWERILAELPRPPYDPSGRDYTPQLVMVGDTCFDVRWNHPVDLGGTGTGYEVRFWYLDGQSIRSARFRPSDKVVGRYFELIKVLRGE